MHPVSFHVRKIVLSGLAIHKSILFRLSDLHIIVVFIRPQILPYNRVRQKALSYYEHGKNLLVSGHH
jgi:hypothetical protein